MKLSQSEWSVFIKVMEFRLKLWKDYLKIVDPYNEFTIETKEVMKSSFISGVTFAIDSFYEGLVEENEKDKE